MPLRVGIFVTDSLPMEAKEILGEFDVFENATDDTTLSQCQVLMAWPRRAKPELLRKMKSLRALQSMSAGVDELDFQSFPRGVEIFTNAGAFTEPVAEHAWGLLLGAAKGLIARNQKTVPRKLRGKTILVLGCGAIGSEVARLCGSIGMRRIGVSRSFRDPGAFEEKLPLRELPAVVSEADAMVIALPLTNETRGIVNADILRRMKKSVVIANVGRGETVVEEDLISWLRSEPEARYATDVFWKREGKEVFDTKAWGLPNFSGTFHNSGLPLGEPDDFPKVEAAKNVRRYLEGDSPRNRIDVSEYL